MPSDLSIVKNDLISLCQTTPEEFWLNFSNKSVSIIDYKRICHRLDKYWKKNVPVPYLTREIYFYNSLFKIEKGVFIPQKDTEILLEICLELINKHWKKQKKLRILDIGAGCGNLAISLAKINPNWQITAVDISKKALKIIKKNVKFHQAENVKILESNLFNNLIKEKKYNVIISNPPYLSNKEYNQLSLLTRQQPRKALLTKNNGYWFYQEILSKTSDFLTKKFLLILEIGYQQKQEIIKIINKYFPHEEIEIFRDKGGQERVIAVYRL